MEDEGEEYAKSHQPQKILVKQEDADDDACRTETALNDDQRDQTSKASADAATHQKMDVGQRDAHSEDEEEEILESESGDKADEKCRPDAGLKDAGDDQSDDSSVVVLKTSIAEQQDDNQHAGKPRSIRFLHKLMQVVSDSNRPDIITWLPDGKEFAIFIPEAFVSELLPAYDCGHDKFSSFTRRLTRWGFSRKSNRNIFSHPFFLRGRMDLLDDTRCFPLSEYATPEAGEADSEVKPPPRGSGQIKSKSKQLRRQAEKLRRQQQQQQQQQQMQTHVKQPINGMTAGVPEFPPLPPFAGLQQCLAAATGAWQNKHLPPALLPPMIAGQQHHYNAAIELEVKRRVAERIEAITPTGAASKDNSHKRQKRTQLSACATSSTGKDDHYMYKRASAPAIAPIAIAPAIANTTMKTGTGLKQERKKGPPSSVMPRLEKLMDLVSNSNRPDLVAWLPDGKEFAINNPRAFASELLPAYNFGNSKFSSFVRRLNRWGFSYRRDSKSGGAIFSHPRFVRGQTDLSNIKMDISEATTNSQHGHDPICAPPPGNAATQVVRHDRCVQQQLQVTDEVPSGTRAANSGRDDRSDLERKKLESTQQQLHQEHPPRLPQVADEVPSAGSRAATSGRHDETALTPASVLRTTTWTNATSTTPSTNSRAQQSEAVSTTAASTGDGGAPAGETATSSIDPIPPAFRDAILSEEDEESCPIHAAVKFADMDILNETLEEQNDKIREMINKLDSNGRTSLDLAALTGQTDMVEVLTSRGGSYKYKNVVRMKRTAKARKEIHQQYLEYMKSTL